MLDYLAFFVDPVYFIAAIIVAVVTACIFGWLLLSTKVTATWTQLVERPTSERQHPYRDPLRVPSVRSVPLLVRAAAVSTFALYASVAFCILIAADEAYRVHFGGCAIALCLFTIGLATAYLATRLIMRGPCAFVDLRGRVTNMAVLSLLIHGVALIAFLAMATDLFDDLRFDVHGIKGTTRVTSLGRLRSRASAGPIWLSVNGHMVGTWQAMGIAAVAHAYVSFAHAVILCALAFQLNERLGEGSARFRNGLLVKLLVTLGALASVGFFVRHRVPTLIETASPSEVETRELALAALNGYEAFEHRCGLPPLPEDASDLSGRHDALLGEYAQVRFRAADPLAYEEQLVKAGWKEYLLLDRGPPPFYPVAHYSFSLETDGKIDLSCSITVDRREGIVKFDAGTD